jgi:hypothetical protein
MTIFRTILVAFLALSVAMLPMVGGAASSVKSADMSVSDDMSDCCPPQTNPCEEGMDNCGSMATCPLKCFSFAGTTITDLVVPDVFAESVPSLVSQTFRSQTGSPPFRPPRV